MKLQVDINCDLGESYGRFKVGNDEEIMPHITSANVACGFHAGDPMTIARTVSLAKTHNVAVGGHPSYPDLLGFGRREMQLTSEEVKNYIIYQMGALREFAKTIGVKLQHVKPHGALYNKAAKEEETSKGIVEAVKTLNNDLILFAPPKSILSQVASEARLHVAHEFFADRHYNPDGSLVSRRKPDALIQNAQEIIERTIKVVQEGEVLASSGEVVSLGYIHTICVHGDTPNAAEMVKALKNGLIRSGIEVKPVRSFI